jgi:hypothetical protein
MGLIGKAKEMLHTNKEKKTGDAPLSPTTAATTSTSTETPAFDAKKVMVIYVLGGPGAGTLLVFFLCS